MYLYVKGINFASFYDFLVDFWNATTEWIFLFFLLFYLTLEISHSSNDVLAFVKV